MHAGTRASVISGHGRRPDSRLDRFGVSPACIGDRKRTAPLENERRINTKNGRMEMLLEKNSAGIYRTVGAIGGAVARAFAREGAKVLLMWVSLLASLDAAAALAQDSKYPPLSEYMMAQETEIALARSAAPEKVSAGATVKILTASGYKVAAQGNNGFVCMVLRGWAAAISTTAAERDLVYDAKLRAPHCFDSVASRTVLPLQELQAKLGMEGKGPDQIAKEVQEAYAEGKLPRMEAVAFAYMFSADQNLGLGSGAWHPHMMVYAPHYENSMLGGNEADSGLPVVGNGGTQFAVTVIPVDDRLAVKARLRKGGEK
jgi:hypothetical protein